MLTPISSAVYLYIDAIDQCIYLDEIDKNFMRFNYKKKKSEIWTILESVYLTTTGAKIESVDVTTTGHVISCTRIRREDISSSAGTR